MCTLQAARRLINTQLTTVMNRAGDYHGRGHQGTITVDTTALQMVMEDYGKCRAAMQEFCDRVDRGEVRSVKTYAKFKELLK